MFHTSFDNWNYIVVLKHSISEHREQDGSEPYCLSLSLIINHKTSFAVYV